MEVYIRVWNTSQITQDIKTLSKIIQIILSLLE
jgi:hypothetical protein